MILLADGWDLDVVYRNKKSKILRILDLLIGVNKI